MTTIFDAWINKKRPIFSRVPGQNGQYSDNDLADHLSYFWDELLVKTLTSIQDIPARQFDPLRCDANWLDFLAQLSGFTDSYWDESWPEQAKRTLISRSFNYIWPNKGAIPVIRFVLTTLEIENLIFERGDFIVDQSSVGDPIGVNFWDFTVVLPEKYRGTDRPILTEKLVRLYKPAWVTHQIIYSENDFSRLKMLGLGNAGVSNPPVLSPNTLESQAIEVR